MFQSDMIPLEIVEDLQMSHHTGALSFASFDQTMVLIATKRLSRTSHREKTKTPAFHGLLTIWNSGIMARAQAMMFAMGTSGYVGSIPVARLTQESKGRASLCVKQREDDENEKSYRLFRHLTSQH